MPEYLTPTESFLRILTWGSLFLLVLFDFIALNVMGIMVKPNVLEIVSFVIAYFLFSYVFIESSAQLYLKGNKKGAYIFQLIGRSFELLNQLIVFIFAAIVFVYIMSASPRDLYDKEILSMDRWLGMDIVYFLSLVNQYSYINDILQYSYLSYWQMPILVVLLIMCKKTIIAYKVLLCLVISSTICSVISFIFPAIDPYPFLAIKASDYPNVNMISGYHHIDDYLGMRNGTLKSLNILELKGVISFPSTHASIAMIMLWGFWQIAWLRWLFLLLNMTAFVSIPITGGHYLTDMIFGIIIAILSILLVNNIVKFVDSRFETVEN